jgi:D-alanyl-lipoteichoic acid acyltransferase DltB (MBOAT superfamily)
MLFNSYLFIFAFLPVVLLVYWAARGHHRLELALAWLTLASLLFYGWWKPAYLWIIMGSMIGNYLFGQALARSHSRALLALGVSLNLALLGYYKYTNFLVDNVNIALSTNFHLDTILLPLAISFFTFQQIAYLVDTYQSKTQEYRFLHYCLFVVFFPQLIAGPIVHHRETIPQFLKPLPASDFASHLSVGLTLFIIGLFKKVVLADTLAESATPVFALADAGSAISTRDAWFAALAYTFQLYFDFSGYSDMAIGLARMFGVVLPMNFFSPYKATNIIDFWRRWHITLSRFLRDYLYIPLGGNRSGPLLRYRNLFITMLLGGMWHGAGWNFLIWGALHGTYLVLNHGHHFLCRRFSFPTGGRLYRGLAWLLTFVAVVVAWVYFRAETLHGAHTLLSAMAGLGVHTENTLPTNDMNPIVIALLISLLAPSSLQMLADFKPVLDGIGPQSSHVRLRWRPSFWWALGLSLFGAYAIMDMAKVSEFLYFQF